MNLARQRGPGGNACVLRSASKTLLIGICLTFLGSGCTDPPPSSASSASEQQAAVTPEALEAALLAADRYLLEDDTQSALAIADRLREQTPGAVAAHELHGRICMVLALAETPGSDAARQRYQEAADSYRRGVEVDGSDAGLHQAAGSACMMAGDSDAALHHFQQAASLDRLNPQYPLLAAQLLIQARRFDEARERLLATLLIDPDQPEAHASLAIIELEQGHIEAAIDRIEHARAIDPRNLQLRIQEARIQRRGGDPKRSLELLVTLSSQERAGQAVASEIAAAYTQIEQHEKAAGAWVHRYQTSKDPERWRAALGAANAYLQANQPEAAIAWFDWARIEAPDAPEVQQFEQALRDLE